MLFKSLLSFAILLTLSPPCGAQSAAKTTAPEQVAPEQSATDAVAERRSARATSRGPNGSRDS
jgi:hypothetical protein